MHRFDCVAIIGVGLIGGSIGLALRRRGLAREIVGVGRRAESLRNAKKVNAVTRTTTSLARGVADAELIVVCTPVGLIARHVIESAAACPPGALITDAGSTKAEIISRLDGELHRGAHFVGSHPIAGSEQTGPENAVEHLFEEKIVVVTPTRRSHRDDVDDVEEFWSLLGAKVVRMTPAAHDRALAATSHLPHLAAYALAASIPSGDFPLSAGGLRDTTRIAAADPGLWRQIFLDNRGPLLASLDKFEQSLAQIRAALEAGDEARLTKLLSQAKRKRDALGN